MKTSRQHYTSACRNISTYVRAACLQLPRVNVRSFRQVQWKKKMRRKGDESGREGQIPRLNVRATGKAFYITKANAVKFFKFLHVRADI